MNVNNDPTQVALVRLLDSTALRHRVLTANLANADTPGYVRQDVNFEEQLAEAVRTGNLDRFSASVSEDRVSPARADGNKFVALRDIKKGEELFSDYHTYTDS